MIWEWGAEQNHSDFTINSKGECIGFFWSTRKQPENNLKNMEERLKGVIDLIRDNPSISRAAMAAELELTEAQIKTAINILKSRKIICHEGPAKGGKWIIK